MIKAALLDFDGTIIDSQPAINGYFFSVLKRKGVQLTEKEQDDLGGVGLEDILVWLRQEKNISFSHLEQSYHKLYFWLFKLHTIRPFPGAIKLLESLQKQHIKMAIVTNSPRKYTELLLKKNHLSHYFDAVVSVDDSGVPKPDPKMLGMAATLLHTSYRNCVMIDDNEPGIVAAHALGMKSIHITEKKKSIATKVVSKIEQAIRFIKK